jgi:DNA invertase Pin-like site-specific DNA recombinase
MKPETPAGETSNEIPGQTRKRGAQGKGGPRGGRARAGSAGHGSKFGHKKEEAVAALVEQRNVEEAARVTNLSPQTLYRWKKIPEFEAAYNEALLTIYRQALGRTRQAAGMAVTVLLKVMYDSAAPASARLKAADLVLRCTKSARRIRDVDARLRAVKRSRDWSRRYRCGKGAGAAPTIDRENRPKAGPAAKLSRRKQEAIIALLTQVNVQTAARVVGIGTTTLYRWLKDPAFAAAYQEAILAAFGQAGARLDQASGPAVTTMLRIMVDPGASAGAHVQAAGLVLEHATMASEEDIGRCVAEMKRDRQSAPAVPAGGKRSFADHARGQPRAA